MAFFSKSLVSRKIEINSDGINSDSLEMKKFLDRIESNYSKLNGIFEELEARFELDERFAPDAEANLQSSNLSQKKPR